MAQELLSLRLGCDRKWRKRIMSPIDHLDEQSYAERWGNDPNTRNA